MKKSNRLQLVVGSILGVTILLFTLKLSLNQSITGVGFLSYILILLGASALAYLSYFDLKSMEVDDKVSLILLIGLLLLNLSLFIILGSEGTVSVSERLQYIPFENLLASLVLGSIFLLTVILSKETFLGQGDVRIAIIVGLIVGISSLWLWLNITIFTALAYGLITALKKHKFRGLRIPFVPFMALGTAIVILLKF